MNRAQDFSKWTLKVRKAYTVQVLVQLNLYARSTKYLQISLDAHYKIPEDDMMNRMVCVKIEQFQGL